MAPKFRPDLTITLLLLVAMPVLADDGQDRESLFSPDEFLESEGVPSKAQLSIVNELYLIDIKPIFEMKCLPCHGATSESNLPWYYPIPGAKQLIDEDIAEAQKHVDMSNDFPFGGHGDAAADLNAIKKSIDEGDMPPFRYRLMHWGSAINSNDKEKIFRWIEQSLMIFADDEGAR